MESLNIDKITQTAIFLTEEDFCSPEKLKISEWEKQYIEKVVVDFERISNRIAQLAEEIVAAYENKEVAFIVMMNGAIYFSMELNRHLRSVLSKLDQNFQFRYSIQFIAVTSYKNNKSMGKIDVKEIKVKEDGLKNKHLLIIEDIYDSGTTIAQFTDYLATYEPLSVKTCFLFYKRNPDNIPYKLQPDFIGFNCPNVFVIGYGLDYNGHFRTMEHVCTINEKGIKDLKI